MAPELLTDDKEYAFLPNIRKPLVPVTGARCTAHFFFFMGKGREMGYPKKSRIKDGEAGFIY